MHQGGTILRGAGGDENIKMNFMWPQYQQVYFILTLTESLAKITSISIPIRK